MKVTYRTVKLFFEVGGPFWAVCKVKNGVPYWYCGNSVYSDDVNRAIYFVNEEGAKALHDTLVNNIRRQMIVTSEIIKETEIEETDL